MATNNSSTEAQRRYIESLAKKNGLDQKTIAPFIAQAGHAGMAASAETTRFSTMNQRLSMITKIQASELIGILKAL